MRYIVQSRVAVMQQEINTNYAGIRVQISFKDFISAGLSIHGSTRKDLEVFAFTQRDTSQTQTLSLPYSDV